MSGQAVTGITQRYSLSAANTTVTFNTRHLFGLGSVTGSMSVIAGSAVVDDMADVLMGVEVDLDAASFASASPARDRVVASRRFLDVASHPVVRFRSSRIERDGDDWVVRGELTVRGVAAPVDVHLSGVESDGDFVIHGAARVDRFAHGMTAARGLASRHLDVAISATATRGDHD